MPCQCWRCPDQSSQLSTTDGRQRCMPLYCLACIHIDSISEHQVVRFPRSQGCDFAAVSCLHVGTTGLSYCGLHLLRHRAPDMDGSGSGSSALWRAIAAGKSVPPATMSVLSFLHTVQLVSLSFSVLAVADMEKSSDVNAFLQVLTLFSAVMTATRWDIVLAIAVPGMLLASATGVTLLSSTVLLVMGYCRAATR